MDGDQKASLVMGLVVGALGLFELSHLVYPYRNPLRVGGRKGSGRPMSRSGLALSGCSLLAIGVIAVANAFSPDVACAVLPWAAAAVFILLLSLLIRDALKR